MLYGLHAQTTIDYSTIVFKLREERNTSIIKNISASSNAEVKTVFPKGKTSRGEIDLIFKIALSDKSKTDKIIQLLETTDDIEWWHFKQIPELLFTPNDPMINSQYYLSLMKAFSAWDFTLGGQEIVVGIVDTGTDPTHFDLIHKFAYNTNDPVNGIDDDNDGFVDNYLGWNMAENNNYVTANIDPHGVGICGIVGAEANNSFGIAGIAPGVKILPVKIMNNLGMLVAAYEGILYAAEHGCKIIVCPWGGIIPDQLSKTIVEFVQQQYGALIIAAAGNSRNEDVYYPASYQGVISVLATNSFNHKWEGSTYGYRIDLAAPGQGILSTTSGNSFTTSSGSSNAAPMVAGLAALVKTLRPHLSNIQIVSQIKASSLYLDTFPSNVPYANKLGAGRINMEKALSDTMLFYPTISDKIIDSDFISTNQTVKITAHITNQLKSKNSVLMIISPLSPSVSVTNGSLIVPLWQSQQIIDLSQFNIRLTAGELAYDQTIPIRFTFLVDNQTIHQIHTVATPKSWFDLNSFNLKMTLAANGKPGFHSLSPLVGGGFRRSNSPHQLWEAGVVIGTSEQKIVSNLTDFDDFIFTEPVSTEIGTFYGKATARFVEKSTVNSLGCNYSVSIETGTNYPLSEAIIYRINLTNNSTSVLNNLRIGIFAIWLISPGAFISTYPELNLSLVQSPNYSPYVNAIAILSPSGTFRNYSFDTGSNPQGININDGLSRSELWQALNNNYELAAPLGKSLPAHLVSIGNFSLQPGESISIAFAFMNDFYQEQIIENLQNLHSQFLSCEVDFDSIIFQNPIRKIAILPDNVELIAIYSMSGEKITFDKSATSIDLSHLNTGVYLFKLRRGDKTFNQKVIVLQ